MVKISETDFPDEQKSTSTRSNRQTCKFAQTYLGTSIAPSVHGKVSQLYVYCLKLLNKVLAPQSPAPERKVSRPINFCFESDTDLVVSRKGKSQDGMQIWKPLTSATRHCALVQPHPIPAIKHCNANRHFSFTRVNDRFV